MTHLFAILGLALVCALWVWIQLRSGRDLYTCGGAGASCKRELEGPPCAGCPKAEGSADKRVEHPRTPSKR